MAYFWEETNDTSKTIIVSTNGIFNTLNYNVIIENKNTGCSITITYTITKAQMDIHPYNVITANDDGYNDYWEIDNIVLYPESTVIIFNRNGNTVYGPQKDYENSTKFDGTYNNKHLPAATYFYIIDLSKYSKKQIRGSLTILR
ncbi:MAG: hypothetical protein A2236_12465 [Bacteroidetes bacterium RIFOXYA2_FULL_33_7]|nr:MAG: hypothetical protein A2236_12465 [Bacteroidetes bacterium RIFOXYA2_FULL_33_7]